MTTKTKKLLLVDGMALLFRAFYATSVSGQFLYNEKGIPTNAVNGLLKHMFTAVNNFRPTHLAVCWDMGSKTFRNEMFDDYKGNREAPPSELIPQFDLAKEAVEAFSIPNIGVIGFEADDCLGTLATTYKDESEVIILTGDRDILQVLDDGIKVALLQKGFGNYDVYTKDRFIEEKGFHPRQFIDVKGLTGDPSDHYPGVKGIGPKTAEKLIIEYGSVDRILECLHELTPSQRKKIEADKENLILSRKLAEIILTVPIDFILDDAKLTLDYRERQSKLNELSIKGMSRILDMISNYSVEEVG